jgi:transglutaminase-like putative cysteine protease
MRLEIVHRTNYRYTGPIAESSMEVRLQPMDGNGQRCLEFELELSTGITPHTYKDGFGNNVHYFNLVRPHRHLRITSRSVVETGLGPDADPGDELIDDFLRFRTPVKDVEGIRDLAQKHSISEPRSREAIEDALDELTRSLHRDFEYTSEVTNVYSSVDDVLALRAGVCQDFAHLFIAIARAMSVPARYVSGYIYARGRRGATAASHAWAEAWLPGLGWTGYDATRPVRTTENHVRLAVGRDYTDAAPTRGVYVGSSTGAMTVSVRTRAL